MSEPTAKKESAAEPAADRRVAELLRVNAELARELRRLQAEGGAEPRSGQTAAARRVAGLIEERDRLAARLREAEREVAEAHGHRQDLERENQALGAEVTRLRTGFAGFLRRARGRLLGSRRHDRASSQ
jgi:predicted  nucleic acid-binding Zn-ribbon protein